MFAMGDDEGSELFVHDASTAESETETETGDETCQKRT